MTKAELVSEIAKDCNITKKAVEAFLKSFTETVQQALKAEGQIRLDGLGAFKVIERKGRTGVNPQTKAKINIPATKAPVFRPAKVPKTR